MLVDFHTHILPGVDDGSSSLECSRQMLFMLKRQGVSHAVLTPHFYASYDVPERFFQRRQAAYERLTEAMSPDFPQVLLGAEVHFFEGISDCDVLDRLAIGDTGHILIEMPGVPWTERMMRELTELKSRHGLTPIIAHVDRYMSPLRSHGIPEMLSQVPALVQVNTNAFLRTSTRRMVLRLLKEGTAHLLGTDCHNIVSRRPDMEKALKVIERSLGAEALEQIRLQSQAVLGINEKS